MRMTEHQEQVALFKWADIMSKNVPDLKLLFAIPNGGLRSKVVAVKLKKEGVKSGVPDIFLPVPKDGYSGLWIELKTKKGRVTENQKWWIARLEEQGYMASVCYGWNAARTLIEGYLFIEKQSN